MRGQHCLSWRLPVEERQCPRHPWPRESYGDRQCLRDTGRWSARITTVVLGASAKVLQPDSEGKSEEDPTIT